MIDTATIKQAAIDSDETGFASVLTNNDTVIALCDEIERLRSTINEFHHAIKDAGWHPGRTDDLLTDIIRAKGDEIERLRADAARYKKLVAMEADLVEPITIWHYLRNPDDLDAAMEAK